MCDGPASGPRFQSPRLASSLAAGTHSLHSPPTPPLPAHHYPDLTQGPRSGCPFQQAGLKRWNDPATWGGSVPSVRRRWWLSACWLLALASLHRHGRPRLTSCLPHACAVTPRWRPPIPHPLLLGALTLHPSYPHHPQPSSVITLPRATKVLLGACMIPAGAVFRQIVIPSSSEVGGWAGGGREGERGQASRLCSPPRQRQLCTLYLFRLVLIPPLHPSCPAPPNLNHRSSSWLTKT